MTDISIPESTLRDVVATQLAAKFSDPEIIQSFVSSILETRVDSFGRVSGRATDPTMVRYAIEGVVRQFVAETAKAWLEDQREELVLLIGEELKNSDVLRRLSEETISKIRVT